MTSAMVIVRLGTERDRGLRSVTGDAGVDNITL